jgi:hypothetical protein
LIVSDRATATVTDDRRENLPAGHFVFVPTSAVLGDYRLRL